MQYDMIFHTVSVLQWLNRDCTQKRYLELWSVSIARIFEKMHRVIMLRHCAENLSRCPPAYSWPVLLDPKAFVPDSQHLLGLWGFPAASGSTFSPHWKVRWWDLCCFCICSAELHIGSDWSHSLFWYHLGCRWGELDSTTAGTANRWNGVNKHVISLGLGKYGRNFHSLLSEHT